jgi:hypothetical protein
MHRRHVNGCQNCWLPSGLHPPDDSMRNAPTMKQESPSHQPNYTWCSREEKMSTPHFDSTARRAIDKGSVSVWRQKVKRIAPPPPILPVSSRRRHSGPDESCDYRRLTKSVRKRREVFCGKLKERGSVLPFWAGRYPLGSPLAQNDDARHRWVRRIAVHSLCGEHVDNFCPSPLHNLPLWDEPTKTISLSSMTSVVRQLKPLSTES